MTIDGVLMPRFDGAPPMPAPAADVYDVAILGAGFEGGLLATVLGHQGVKVLMLDAGTHPRFALGESTVRHTFKLLKIIGERYQVPEIMEKFSRAAQLHTHVASSFGEKRNFGFIYHREGQHQDPSEANQLVIPPFREGYEAHLYRQDVDTFLTYTAVHYGAKVFYKTLITEVDFDKQGVTLRSQKGEPFRARFLIDASGTGGALGKLLNLREDPPRLRLNTRCLFTHMIDVKPYDDLDLPRGVPRMPERWYNGTCHHIFDGGWMWVIPFNNREGSTNPLCSVGVHFDNARFPRPKDMTPDEEWEHFLSRFPSIHAQFKDAKPTREWISTDRLQTSTKQIVGERWILTAAASGAGFIDALFSRGLATSAEVISALIPRVLSALRDDDFSPERFEYIERLQRINMLNNDRLTHSCYLSFQNYDLWNAWFRIWALGVGLGDLRLADSLRRYAKTRDESVLPDSEEPLGLFLGNNLGFKKLFEDACAQMELFEQGQVTAEQATGYIFGLLAKIDFAPPVNRFGDPSMRVVNVGKPSTLASIVKWLVTSAPPEIREQSLGSISDVGPLRWLGRGRIHARVPAPAVS